MPAAAVPQLSANPLRSSMGDSGDFVRLHITPLDPELLKIVIPASVLPAARNISYHTIETFPEKRYGYVDLPQVEAEKLKKKLHGATLKGSKMKIEKARPEERIEPTGEEVKEKKKKSSTDGSERSKKRKREVDVLEGMTLKDRKVKRGWTEEPTSYKKKSKKDRESKDKSKEKKKRPKSKYTDQEECLLKTKLPANAMGNLPADDPTRKKKKKGSSRQVTVHEFEKTTKFPSFLKSSTTTTNGKPAVEFVEGKGWVDEEGNVVEAVKQRGPERREKIAKPEPVVEEEDDSTTSSGTSSDDTSSEEESGDEEIAQTPKKAERQDESSSDSETSDDESPTGPAEQVTPLSAAKSESSKRPPSSSSKSLTIKIPPPETPSASKVHPLEALYKRPKPDDDTTQTPAAKAEPFSFFGGGDDNEEQEESGMLGTAVPMTPFTRQDYEWRNIRSAAPTPDTAHPTRMANFWSGSPQKDVDMEDGAIAEEVEEEEGEEDEEAEAPAQATSDFQKWFWENRRDLNRSWMSRRKTAAKEKRHRENKARASKAV